MEPIDIIYTPLDIPPIPKEFDLVKFKEWCNQVYPQAIINEVPGSRKSQEMFGDQYPWDLVWARWMPRGGWMDDFEKHFPELARYFWEAFGLEPSDLGPISILPMRTHVRGLGFWHTDNDTTGLRLYLENEHPDENPLVFRKTIQPYNARPQEINAWKTKELTAPNPVLENEVLIGKILHPQQGYYLNNIRAVHSPLITKESKRIACFIQGTPETRDLIHKKTRDLIVRSAEKYKDYALIW